MNEDVFDLIGYRVLIHAPEGATQDALDQAIERLVEYDLDVVIEEAIFAEIARWNETLGLEIAVPLTVTVQVT